MSVHHKVEPMFNNLLDEKLLSLTNAGRGKHTHTETHTDVKTQTVSTEVLMREMPTSSYFRKNISFLNLTMTLKRFYSQGQIDRKNLNLNRTLDLTN